MYASKGTMFDRLRENGVACWELLPPDKREGVGSLYESIQAVFAIEPVDDIEWPDTIPLPGYPGADHTRKYWLTPYQVCWWEFRAPNTSIEGTTRCAAVTTLVPRKLMKAVPIPEDMVGDLFLAVIPFVETSYGIIGPYTAVMAVVDKEGMVNDKFMYQAETSWEQAGDVEKNMGWIGSYCVRSIQQALALMACKNVETVFNKAAPRLVKSKKQRRNAKGRSRRYDFYTLRVFAGHGRKRRVIYDGPDSTDPAMLKAHHLCRGHFAHYTEAAPMFGNPKLVGRFWHPPHARGSLDAGLIEKDYEVVS